MYYNKLFIYSALFMLMDFCSAINHNIHLTFSNGNDEIEIIAGVSDTLSDGFDTGYDMPIPPLPPEINENELDVRFINDDSPVDLSIDIREYNFGLELFEIQISSVENQDIILTWDSSEFIENAIYYIDDSNSIYYLDSIDSLPIQSSEVHFGFANEYEIGCMNENACNYIENALSDDGSCIYSSTFCEDTDNDGLGNNGSQTNYCPENIPENWVVDCEDPAPDCQVNFFDCNNDCGGNAIIDECGVCTSGLTELESNYLMDECGVCNGDNSTCSDCAGIPNGESYLDNCNVCDNDASNDCVQDCAGIWGGTQVYDECGLCGGDNSTCSGCTDISAFNYDESAIVDDNTCNYGYSFSYDLGWGNNLIGFPGDFENNASIDVLEQLEQDLEINVNFLLGQGVGLFNTTNGWSGNLNELNSNSGYWLNIEGNENWDLTLISESQLCDEMPISDGNNLLSYKWGSGSSSTLDALGGEEFASNHFKFILGQGVGLFNTENGWSGNLNSLEEGKGYWLNMIVTSQLEDGLLPIENFKWGMENCDDVGNINVQPPVNTGKNILIDYQIPQSTNQSFYLIKEIENISYGDVIFAYCENQLVGVAEWNGSHTPVPVMGRDISEQTIGFCEQGEQPQFFMKNVDFSEKIKLVGNVQEFSNLGVHTIEKLNLSDNLILPSEFYIASAFPNPFNPITTIEISVPEIVETRRVVSLQVYDINGRLLTNLINGHLESGFHSIEWDATGFPSGVYFIKMDSGDPSTNSGQGFIQTQKVVLMK